MGAVQRVWCEMFFLSSPRYKAHEEGQLGAVHLLLLLKQGPEADGEVGGVRVDQDAEAEGDAGQAASPRLRRRYRNNAV